MRDVSHREPRKAPLGRWRKAAPCRGRDTSGWPLLRSALRSALQAVLTAKHCWFPSCSYEEGKRATRWILSPEPPAGGLTEA